MEGTVVLDRRTGRDAGRQPADRPASSPSSRCYSSSPRSERFRSVPGKRRRRQVPPDRSVHAGGRAGGWACDVGTLPGARSESTPTVPRSGTAMTTGVLVTPPQGGSQVLDLGNGTLRPFPGAPRYKWFTIIDSMTIAGDGTTMVAYQSATLRELWRQPDPRGGVPDGCPLRALDLPDQPLVGEARPRGRAPPPATVALDASTGAGAGKAPPGRLWEFRPAPHRVPAGTGRPNRQTRRAVHDTGTPITSSPAGGSSTSSSTATGSS